MASKVLVGFRGVLQQLLTPACYDTLLVRHELLNVPCLTRAASKALGLGIVVGSAIVKVPQIVKIWSARSAEGLSLLTFALELVVYLINSAYNYTNGNAFSTWGEMAFLAVQGVVLVALILHFTHRTHLAALSVPAALAAGYTLCSGAVPADVMQSLFTSTVAIFVFSRLPQIVANYRAGSTGQLSAITTGLNFAGSAARIFTTLQEVDDPLVLVSFLIGTLLNGVLLAQLVYYWNRAPAPPSADAARPKRPKKD